jgi:DNA-directed RNA polymerase subunit RPC12/RpoP
VTVLCAICGKLIPDAEADTHCEAVHGDDDSTDYQCPDCGKLNYKPLRCANCGYDPRYHAGQTQPKPGPDGGWRDIATAPANVNVLVWDARRRMCLLAFYSNGAQGWLDPFNANHAINPTHWQPLPPPPKVSK